MNTATRQENRLAEVSSETWKDSDGHWILLKDGYQIDGVHAIHESTEKKALRRLRDVRPCCCIDCTARKAAK